MTALELRTKLQDTKRRFGRGEATIDDLYAAADAYIEAIKEHKRRTGDKKLRIPARGYLIRAI